MPIIEYKCEVCKSITEVFYKKKVVEFAEVIECEECGSSAYKMISKTGNPKFLGKGFYHTDYKNKK